MKRPALGHLLGYTALTVMLTAGAAQSLSGSNTVFTDDIVDNNITAADLGTNSVSRAKIQDDAIAGSEIVANAVGASEIVANAVGGSEIDLDLLVYWREGPVTPIPHNDFAAVQASCNSGDRAISGGYNQTGGNNDEFSIITALANGSDWSLSIGNFGTTDMSFTANVTCLRH